MMDVLGHTFDEVCAALRPRPHDVKTLRSVHRALLHGHAPEEESGGRLPPGAGELRADVAPVVRVLRDPAGAGELTKFVQRLPDGLETESVLVPMQRTGGIWKTLCVSSQVGCARGCTFCETAQLGLLRNLTAAEIVGQVVAAQRVAYAGAGDAAAAPADEPDRAARAEAGHRGGRRAASPRRAVGRRGRIRNVVFMGMGEPLDNYEHVVRALQILMDPSGLSFAGERITISTVGRTAGIRRLARLGWRRLNLAVSLNAPNDEIRSQIMPVNRLEPMAQLRAALLEYPLRKCQFFMMEYVLIPGVNDARAHAYEVAEYLRPLKSMLNVIPYNPRRDSPWPAPRADAVMQFVRWVGETGQGVKLRLTKGRDHRAACGQLGNPLLARRIHHRDAESTEKTHS
ncbi:MAG: 23S rRNA (adenine(2503)-C(2))-methyltransferase RlmN [Planctomycetota bacterium]